MLTSSQRPPYLLTPSPRDSSKQVPEETSVGSPEVQGSNPTFYLASSTLDLELHHLVVTTTQGAPNLYFLNMSFLVSENK